MARHLQSCTDCQVAELRFVEAEHAFDVERGAEPGDERDSRARPDEASAAYPTNGKQEPAVAPEAAQPVLPRSESSGGEAGVAGPSAPPEPSDRPWRPGRRTILLGLASFLLLASAVLAVSLDLTGEPTPSGTQAGDLDEAPVDDGDSGGADNARPLPDPESVTVSVLNGADVDLLAADTADALEQEGFEIIVVADAPRPVQETRVIYDGGTKREARRVARELDGPEIRSAAGERAAEQAAAAEGADVVVVTGPDAQE